MEDRRRGDTQRLEHGLEQALPLAEAMFGRTEDAIDEAKRLLACGLADQAAKLRLAEIGIGDDNDAEPVGPCGAHQLDGRLETIAMVCLGSELLRDRARKGVV